MRWKKVLMGDTKKITKFLWLPLSIGRDSRWLERATYMKIYIGCGSWEYLYWIDEE